MKLILLATITALPLATLTGCQFRVEHADPYDGLETVNRVPTLGEELSDLKQAHDAGVLTDEEYDSLKKALTRKYEIHN